MQVSQVQLNDIAFFIEVARRKSFSQAARALSIPTSTLSRHISQLEETIGMRLVNRNTRRVDLTEAGTIYLQRCQGLIEDARLAHKQLQALSHQPQGVLHVSMPHSLASMFLADTVHEFTEAYPDVECHFDLSMRAPDLNSGAFDVMLRFGSAGRYAGELHSIDLVSLKCFLYASPEYLAQYGEPATPHELSSHQCLRSTSREEDSVWTLHTAEGRSETVAVQGRLSANNISIGSVFAGLGLGVMRVPQCEAMRSAITNNALQRILPQWSSDPLTIYAVFPSRILPAKTRAFMEFIQPKLAPTF
jgi:DNA-binding transcriptional LysR family regulator